MIETSDYWIQDNKFIFKPEFNSSNEVYVNLISESSELIFSNYDDVNICAKTKNKYEEKYKKNYQYSKFNRQVELPENFTLITFGLKFNRQVELRKNLTLITFGHYFKQNIELPNKLTHLTFGNYFNKEIKLPENLLNLTFGLDFNHQVELPKNLTLITFG